MILLTDRLVSKHYLLFGPHMDILSVSVVIPLQFAYACSSAVLRKLVLFYLAYSSIVIVMAIHKAVKARHFSISYSAMLIS